MANEWATTTYDTVALAEAFIETQDSTVLMHVTPYLEEGVQKFMISVAT